MASSRAAAAERLLGAPSGIAVKICGLTVPEEALACAGLGVWGVGVVFASESPRRIDPARAREVVAGLPAGVARVGVFVGWGPAEIAGVARLVGLTHVQVHGDADPVEVRRATGLPVIEGVRVDGEAALERARAVAHTPDEREAVAAIAAGYRPLLHPSVTAAHGLRLLPG
jgi:phosphoribosylanthranilate isomerase